LHIEKLYYNKYKGDKEREKDHPKFKLIHIVTNPTSGLSYSNIE